MMMSRDSSSFHLMTCTVPAGTFNNRQPFVGRRWSEKMIQRDESEE
jgi:hypothetical protein